MHDRDVLAPDVIHHNFANARVHAPVPQEQQVSSLERRLHTSRQHDDNRRRRVRRDGETFPQHERRAENEREVENLCQELPRGELREVQHIGCVSGGFVECGTFVVLTGSWDGFENGWLR